MAMNLPRSLRRCVAWPTGKCWARALFSFRCHCGSPLAIFHRLLCRHLTVYLVFKLYNFLQRVML